jgi:hypothetical protein
MGLKEYLRLPGSGSSSSSNGGSREGMWGVVRGRDSLGSFLGAKSIVAVVSSEELTSSMYCYVSKSLNPKWVRQASKGTFNRSGSVGGSICSSSYSSSLSINYYPTLVNKFSKQLIARLKSVESGQYFLLKVKIPRRKWNWFIMRRIVIGWKMDKLTIELRICLIVQFIKLWSIISSSLACHEKLEWLLHPGL